MTESAPQHDEPRSSRKSARWRTWLRDLLLLALVFVAIQWWQSRGLVTGKAPPLVGHLVNGQPYQLDPSGGPVLVHFWASWCPVCRLEQASIDAIAADRAVITVATTSGTVDEVTAYLAEHDLRMPVLMDENGVLAQAWGISGVPATFIVDRDGAITFSGMGYSTGFGLRLRLWLAEL